MTRKENPTANDNSILRKAKEFFRLKEWRKLLTYFEYARNVFSSQK